MFKNEGSRKKFWKSCWPAAIGGLVLPLFIGLSQAAQGSRAVVVPISEFPYERQVAAGESQAVASIAFDKKYVYVSSPDGILFRTEVLDSTSQFTPIFHANKINKIYVHDDTLYVLTAPEKPDPQKEPEHMLFQSRDHGSSFTPIDRGLKQCSGDSCYYLISTELFATGDLIYTNAGAGPNLLVSKDEGDTWTALSGELAMWSCTNSTFKIAHRTVFLGGECPLDFAFLQRGTLGEDMLNWAPASELQPVKTPALSNRNIMAIEQRPGSRVVLAGAEGALLRSIDDGHSFEYAFKYPEGGGSYPYVSHILFPSRRYAPTLIGGADSVTFKPYLAYGTENGEKWTDISNLIPALDYASVTDLEEDNDGRIIALIANVEAKKIIIAEVALDRPGS